MNTKFVGLNSISPDSGSESCLDQIVDRGGFSRSTANFIQLGVSQRLQSKNRANQINGIFLGNSLASSQLSLNNAGESAMQSTQSMFSQAQPTNATRLNAKLYEQLNNIQDWLQLVYPRGHEYTHHEIKSVIHNLLEADVINAKSTETEWKEKTCWTLLSSYGMAPRPVSTYLYLASFGSSAISLALDRIFDDGDNNIEKTSCKYEAAVYLCHSEHSSIRPSYTSVRRQVHTLAANLMTVHVYAHLNQHNEFTNVTPLSVQQIREAVEFIQAHFVLKSNEEQNAPVLILCESPELLISAVSIAAAYTHLLSRAVLFVDDNDIQTVGHENNIDGSMNTSNTSSALSSSTSYIDSTQSNGSAYKLSMWDVYHTLCVVPELLFQFAQLMSSNEWCSVHPVHIQNMARYLYETTNGSPYTGPKSRDRMGVTRSTLEKDGATLWTELFEELDDDIDKVSKDWPKGLRAYKDASWTYLCNKIMIANGPKCNMRLLDDYQVDDKCVSYVCYLAQPCAYVHKHHIHNHQSVRHCNRMFMSMDDSKYVFTSKDISEAVLFISNALENKDSRVLMVCDIDNTAWQACLVLAEYVHAVVGSEHATSQILCMIASTIMRTQTIQLIQQSIHMSPESPLINSLALYYVEGYAATNKQRILSAQAPNHVSMVLRWCKELNRRHQYRKKHLEHKCAEMPWFMLSHNLAKAIDVIQENNADPYDMNTDPDITIQDGVSPLKRPRITANGFASEV